MRGNFGTGDGGLSEKHDVGILISNCSKSKCLLDLELDLIHLRCKIQWAVSPKKIWLKCPTKVRSTQLSYILKALLRDTPLAYRFVYTMCHLTSTWPPATCHLPPGTWNAKTMGKWGIPEKSFENVAQLHWPYLRRTLQSKVIAGNKFLGYCPLYFTL